MSALGRKQPFRSRDWDGRDGQTLSVRFRPQVDIRDNKENPATSAGS
jgi:hypothetical protein